MLVWQYGTTSEQTPITGRIHHLKRGVVDGDEDSGTLSVEQMKPGDDGQIVPSTNKRGKRKSKKKKKAKDEKTGQGGKRVTGESNPGIRTFFRLTHREQLELFDLADRKAGILLSISGLILPLSFAATATWSSLNTLLAAAVVSVCLSSLVSVFFAVLAVRPRMNRIGSGGGKAETMGLMHFSNISQMDPAEYALMLKKSFGKEGCFRKHVARHLHQNSNILVAKFQYVRWAYTAFVLGFVCGGVLVSASVITNERSATAVGIQALADNVVQEAHASVATLAQGREAKGFVSMTDVREPSAVLMMADGKALLVDDEKPFALYSGVLNQQGHWQTEAIIKGEEVVTALGRPDLGFVSDLEGLARDRVGNIFAVTSHSRNKQGVRYPQRELLLRFHYDGRDLQAGRVYEGLGDAMRHYLATALHLTDQGNRAEGFNIEGLEVHPRTNQLLFGLRGPLTDANQALVLVLENTEQYLAGKEMPRFRHHLLDLQGQGVRSIHYSEFLGGYLLAARHPKGKAQHRPFRLYFFAGEDFAAAPRKVTIDGAEYFARLEGIGERVLDDGSRQFVLVSDDAVGGPAPYGHVLVASVNDLLFK